MPNTYLYVNYLNEVFENLDEVILLIRVEPDNQYRLVLFNKAAVDKSGYGKDSVGKLVKDILPAERYSAVVKQYEKVVRSRATLEYTHWSDVPLGRQAYITKLVPILNALGECSLIVGISQHVTPTLQKQKQSDALADNLEAIADTMQSHIAIIDARGEVLYASSELNSVLPKDNGKQTVQNKPDFYKLLSSKDAKEFSRALKNCQDDLSARTIINLKLNGKRAPYVCSVRLHKSGRYVLYIKALDSLDVETL